VGLRCNAGDDLPPRKLPKPARLSLVLRWNLKDEIMSQLADNSRWGAKLAMSIPEQSVI
jgi:hypothetical protein